MHKNREPDQGHAGPDRAMKISFLTLGLIFALCNAAAAQDDAGYNNAVAQATRIIKTKIIPHYETRDGFTVKPLDIDYQHDPAIAKMLDQYGSIWKQMAPVVADTYASIQRKVNDRNKPDAGKYRALLAEAFDQAVELRGGGSASGQLLTFAPAQVEWIIARLGAVNTDAVPDAQFISRLTQYLSVNGTPQTGDVQRVLARVKAVERFLKKDDAGFLRAAFLAYFQPGQ
jgi:hypothetical protein